MSGRFSWIPDYVMDEESGYRTVIDTFESGKEQIKVKHGSIERKWTLTFPGITLTQVNDMKAFIDLQKGAYGTFEWINPLDNILYTVRFSDDEFQYTRNADDVYNVNISLTEII